MIESGRKPSWPRRLYAGTLTGDDALVAAARTEFSATRAASGFSHSKAMNAATRSHTIIAQNTRLHDPVRANSHAAPGPAKAAATPLAV